MMMNKKFQLATLLLLVIVSPVFAQENWEEAGGVSGEIEDAEVVIEKDREIELPVQPRSFEKVPPPAVNTEGIRQNYIFSDLNLAVPSSEVDIKALKLEEEPLEKYYGNLVKLGYGNFNSPLAELYLYNKRNKGYMYGLQAKHLSFGKGPVDGRNSASGESSLKMEGSYFGRGATVGANAFYRLSNWHYYGYNPGTEVDRDTLLHRFNRYGAALSLDNNTSNSTAEFRADLSFSGQNDNFDVSEYWPSLKTALTFPVQDQFNVGLGVSADLVSYTDSVTVNRQRIGVEPSIEYSMEKFSATVGLRYVYQSDTALPASQMYPLLKGTYNFSSSFRAYAEVSGDNELVTWQGLTDRNPYLGRRQDIHNANKILNLEGGIAGNTSFLTYKLGFARKIYKEYAFFINRLDDPSKFGIVYDSTNFKVLDLFAEAELYLGNSFTLRGSLHALSYASGTFDNVPHLPSTMASLDVNYLFFNKIRARSGLIYRGGINGYNTVLNESVVLDPATDIYINLDYLLSKRATIFFNFQNMANQEYELLSNYPVRGLTVKGGFSYSF